MKLSDEDKKVLKDKKWWVLLAFSLLLLGVFIWFVSSHSGAGL